MANAKAKKVKSQKVKEKGSKNKEATQDSFDFGGLPEYVDFKRNLGCGG